jgi:hypothetical protein
MLWQASPSTAAPRQVPLTQLPDWQELAIVQRTPFGEPPADLHSESWQIPD